LHPNQFGVEARYHPATALRRVRVLINRRDTDFPGAEQVIVRGVAVIVLAGVL